MKDASERATEDAQAIAEGIDCLAHIRALRSASHVTDAAEVARWQDALGLMRRSLEDTVTLVEAGGGEMSLRVDDDLLRNIEEVQSHLATLSPGAALPAHLFDLVDSAWGRLGMNLSP
ncbi:MAG: hypothetical protein QM820_21135 [Minicystis sp.]